MSNIGLINFVHIKPPKHPTNNNDNEDAYFRMLQWKLL